MKDDVSEYLQAVLDRDAARAKSTIMTLVEDQEDLLAVFEVLDKAQVTIGDLWEAKTISVADEHFATQVALDLISTISNRHRSLGKKAGRAAAFSCEGEFHNVGLRIFSSILSARGWSVEFLGVDIPVLRVVEALATREKVDLLCVSITMDFNLQTLLDSLRKLRGDKRVASIITIVGGRMFESSSAREALSESVNGRRLADHVTWNIRSGLEYVDSLERKSSL